MSLLDRRTVLIAGVAVTLAGCGDSKDSGSTPSPTPSATAPSSTTPPASTTVPTTTPSSTPSTSAPTLTSTAPNWNTFARSLKGRVYLPSTSGYAAAHQLFNPRWDSVRPRAVVKAADPADVQKAINFARTNKLVLVPKSGGHSYVGASTIANGLQLDVGALKGMSYANGVLTVGAGARLYDVHAFLDRYGRSLPTGTCPTVGVAGLTLGGGMGIHTRTYGLTCDRVISMSVITADGKAHNVSASSESDLFVALRGSGGGNLGVVTSFQFATIPATKLGFFRLTWPESQAAAVVRGWQKFAQSAPTTAWGNLHIDAKSNGTLSIRVLGVSTTGNATAAAAQLESFVGAKASVRTLSVKSHLEAVKYLGGGTTSPRQGFLAGSDVLKGSMDAATITGLLGAVKAAARAGTPASAILDPLGGQASKEPAGGSSWPWRGALAVVQWYSSAQGKTAQTFIANGHKAVRPYSAGGYVNYVEAGRAVSSYYGASAAKLQAAKKKYDPTNFFRTPYTLI
ncbi:FAD/FMN-containing dehydrogenase [Kribbella sp. VKM Ac-2571]|uniref:FAD-binding oxidoreductase n=1 Tax=Kribbella sp. VKM Ac-2571 TaxID=2512222 RepID=UPI00105B64D7|nr:FAD-binding oxidoreductase [Kribbella sp. VKM Ac-2571]TDO52812.1 FAD/FMN-containing dehydrogenase [Kribbella sp. VKM Ac-2571]